MDFLRIIQEKLQPINGISSTETIISLNEGFKRQAPIMSDEFDEIDDAELVGEEE